MMTEVYIVVHSNYRRFGMGYELVKTRTLLVNYFSSGFSVKKWWHLFIVAAFACDLLIF